MDAAFPSGQTLLVIPTDSTEAPKSYQPILSFLAETKEFVAGELRNGDRPTGKQIARHLQEVFRALPRCVVSFFARADSGFYCWEAVEAYEKFKCSFIIVARKTSRLLNELIAAEWKPSPRTDAAEQCEFWYQPKGWGKAYRFLALRYERKTRMTRRGRMKSCNINCSPPGSTSTEYS